MEPSVSGFINEYLDQGRTVTAFVLKDNPARDASLVMKAKEINKTPAVFGMLNENCTTACADALRSSGVLGKDQDPEHNIFYDSPASLQEAFESGILKDHVKKTVIFDPTVKPATTPEEVEKYLRVPDVDPPRGQ